MLLLSWAALSPGFGGVIMLPVVVFGWLGLVWTSIIGRVWPTYVAALTQLKGAEAMQPDRRATPQVLTTGFGLVLIGLSYASGVWMFVSDLQRKIAAAPVDPGFSLTPFLVPGLSVAALLTAAGVFVLIVGPRRNKWYPAQQAYLGAALKGEPERGKRMRMAVTLLPPEASLPPRSGRWRIGA